MSPSCAAHGLVSRPIWRGILCTWPVSAIPDEDLIWRRLPGRRLMPTDGGGSVDVGNGTVTHHVDVSLFPNWQGYDQVRRVTIEGAWLSIIASDRTSADGQTFHAN
jgi:Lipocalin-like domain